MIKKIVRVIVSIVVSVIIVLCIVFFPIMAAKFFELVSYIMDNVMWITTQLRK